VIARFFSLLDVTIILLGMLMLALTQARLHAEKQDLSKAPQPAGPPEGMPSVDFIYVYAGTAGSERGRCYLLGPGRRFVRELRTDVPLALQGVTVAHGSPDGAAQAVMLLVSGEGFDSMWDHERLAEMQRAWELTIVPVYNAAPGGR
jgi:hypothetical protein